MQVPGKRVVHSDVWLGITASIPNILFTTSTAYFPPLAWVLRAITEGQWRWEAHENYQKGGWRNRCCIAAANGPLLLSVPLRGGKHRGTPVREVAISYRTDWPRQHEQSIRSAYGRAPYFDFYAEPLLEVLHRPTADLWSLNWELTRTLVELLDLPLELTTTDSFCAGSAGETPVAESVPPYPQVFQERHGFLPGLSILDGLFCLGPELVSLADS